MQSTARASTRSSRLERARELGLALITAAHVAEEFARSGFPADYFDEPSEPVGGNRKRIEFTRMRETRNG